VEIAYDFSSLTYAIKITLESSILELVKIEINTKIGFFCLRSVVAKAAHDVFYGKDKIYPRWQNEKKREREKGRDFRSFTYSTIRENIRARC